MSWPSFEPSLSSDERRSIARKKKQDEWDAELSRVRERAKQRTIVPLGPDSRKRYDALYKKSKEVVEHAWSDDVRACYEESKRLAPFDEWATDITKDLGTFAADGYSSGELDRIKKEIKYAQLRIKSFLDLNRWRDPVFRRQLPDMLRNARSAPERRTIMQRMATPTWADMAAIQAVYRERIEKERETGVAHEVDHIVPIVNRRVCGLHVPWNLRVITREENRKKSNKFITS